MLRLLFFNHDLFFWRDLKEYGGSNSYPAVTLKPHFRDALLGAICRGYVEFLS